MELKEMYQRYKAAKLQAEQAAKEEEKYKKLLKDAMKKELVSDYTDEDGYRFERIVQHRKSMDESGVMESLKERGLTSCIKSIEAVDEEAVLVAIENGEYPADELQKFLTVKEIVMLKMTAPGKEKK